MTDRITYEDLVARFGKPMAFDLLITIEKLARIKQDLSSLDEAARLQLALDALQDTSVETGGLDILPELARRRAAD